LIKVFLIDHTEELPADLEKVQGRSPALPRPPPPMPNGWLFETWKGKKNDIRIRLEKK